MSATGTAAPKTGLLPYEAVVRILESIGVDTVFGGSGEADAVLLIALKNTPGIKTVTVRNEQAASFMACGYAMFSDRLGVCFSTAGPGEFNLLSGLAVALSDSLPLLALSGFVGAAGVGKGALNEASGLHRTPDSRAIFAATTKRTFTVAAPEQTCDVLEQAINVAFEGRPGPVHVHVPADVADRRLDNYRDIRVRVQAVEPDPNSVAAAADLLASALAGGERIIALLGYGVIRSHAEKQVLDLLEAHGIPFVTTMDAKGVLPENHPLAEGVFGTSGDASANAAFRDASVVLAIGNSFAQNATFGFAANLYAGKRLIHVNIDAGEIGKVYPADCGIVSDARLAAQALAAGLRDRKAPAQPKRDAARDRFFFEALQGGTGGIHPGLLVQKLSTLLPERAIVLGDAGAHMLWLSAYLQLNAGQFYQNPGSFGPMASSVNAAIGIKAANRDRVVVCGCGDGGYLMGGFELVTAVHNDLPVVWIVFNNGEFGIVKYFQRILHHETAFTEVPSPDLVAYAQACGALGYRVTTVEEFERAFTEAVRSNRPALIDAVIDPAIDPPYRRTLS
jgi:acetolactate synthase I/II/III large subunit